MIDSHLTILTCALLKVSNKDPARTEGRAAIGSLAVRTSKNILVRPLPALQIGCRGFPGDNVAVHEREIAAHHRKMRTELTPTFPTPTIATEERWSLASPSRPTKGISAIRP